MISSLAMMSVVIAAANTLPLISAASNLVSLGGPEIPDNTTACLCEATCTASQNSFTGFFGGPGNAASVGLVSLYNNSVEPRQGSLSVRFDKDSNLIPQVVEVFFAKRENPEIKLVATAQNCMSAGEQLWTDSLETQLELLQEDLRVDGIDVKLQREIAIVSATCRKFLSSSSWSWGLDVQVTKTNVFLTPLDMTESITGRSNLFMLGLENVLAWNGECLTHTKSPTDHGHGGDRCVCLG